MASGDPESSHTAPATTTFVSLTGPAGNIGDALIRRETLNWALGTSGDLVAYVGDAPDVWLDQLGMPGDATVLRTKQSLPRWFWMMLTAPRRPVLIFEAGEIPLDRGNAVREVVFLLETLIVRIKGGVVVRPPRGIRAPSWPAIAIHRVAARASQVTLWRDAATLRVAKTGRLVPDIGFAAGRRPGLPWSERSELLVSLRGTRAMPSDAWVQTVREFAERSHLKIRTVVQVREDEDRARELATALGGVFEAWGETDSVTQERLLRERYDGAQMVVSDRMHVLVLAALSGAIPVELVPTPTAKISHAFATVGYSELSLDAIAASPESMRAFLHAQHGRTADLEDRITAAEQRLTSLATDIRSAIHRVRA